MKIITSQKFCIIIPLNPKLDSKEVKRLEEEIKLHAGKRIGINLDYVVDCTIEFLDFVKKLKTELFNIHSDILSLLLLMNIDKTTSLYTTEEDFKTNRRRLLNRRFNIV